MKIRVSVTLDVDPEAWKRTYGVEQPELRTDVLLWAENTLHEQLDQIDCRQLTQPKRTIAAHADDGVPGRPAMSTPNWPAS